MTAVFRFFVLTTALVSMFVAAARASDIGLTVEPMVFEFTAPFGSEQHASVLVTNASDTPEQVLATPMDWRMTRTGDVVLMRATSPRAHSLTRYLRITPASFVLKARESRNVAVSLQLPGNGNASEDVLWGGFVFQAFSLDERATLIPGATLLVYDTAKPTPAHLTLTRFAKKGNHFTAELVNDSATYVRPLASLRITRLGRVIREDAVPLNVLFPGDRRIISIAAPRVSAASYDVDLLIQYGAESIIDGAAHVRVP